MGSIGIVYLRHIPNLGMAADPGDHNIEVVLGGIAVVLIVGFRMVTLIRLSYDLTDDLKKMPAI